MLRLVAVVCALAACGTPTSGDDPPDARPGGGTADAEPADAEPAGFRVQYADPDHGPFRGETEITVRGNDFADGDTVWIGGRQALEVEWIDSRRLRVITPPGDPGDADIEVRHAGGESASRADAFTYDALAIDPPSGSTAGNTFVTITGLGTDFADGTLALLDGVPLLNVDVLGATRLTGYTPPGTLGDAELVVTTATTVHEVDRAFTYYTTGDPFAGGFSGGPIDGVLNVVVLDNWTKNGLPGAYVVVGDPATSPHQGLTDALGQITFSGDDLVGPVTVTTTKQGFEVATFACFDAENVTIWLRSPLPPPDPNPGPGSVGPVDGEIHGHVMFGDATGLGTPVWDLIPEPRTATERKRIYVTTSAPTMFSSPRPPLAPIDYEFDPDRVAWEFSVTSRPGAYAVVALAGLYDEALDPTGQGVHGFEPYALGVTRGVLVGPDESVTNIDVVVNIPLDAAANLELVDPPPLGTPGWLGPTEYTIKSLVDLGGDGAILFGNHGLPFVADLPPPGVVTLPPGTTEILIDHAPPRFGTIGDASYTFQVGAYTGGYNPYSVRIERGVPALGAVEIGDFIGVPRPLDPPPGGVASTRRVHFENEADDDDPTFHLHSLIDATTGAPVWRAITCGGLRDYALPDLSTAGFPDWPTPGAQLVWTMYSIDAVGGDYDQFTYRWLGATYWTGYAADAVYATYP